MRIRAAVVPERGAPFQLETLELEPPRPDEVLVRVVSAGICRTDLHIRNQEYPVPAFPVVPGHESTGVVEAVGADVRGLAVGDWVIASYPSCGRCPACRRGATPYCDHGFALSFGGARLDGTSALRRGDGSRVNGHVFQQSSFATHALVHAHNLVVVPRTVPDLAALAPLACGIQTGAGAVLEALRVGTGSTLVVWGAGSVGLGAVMAAASAGVSVIAVDHQPARRQLALDLGAGAAVDGGDPDLAARLSELAPAGIDHAVDTTGSPAVLALALDTVRIAGEVALVGAAPTGTTAPIDMGSLLNGRRLRGVIQGDAVPQAFIPRLLELHAQGRLPFERLISFYDFDDINRAVSEMSDGTVIKPVLRISAP